MRRLLLPLLALVASPAAAQLVNPAGAPACRQIYTSAGAITVGNNSTARSSMLPVPMPGTSMVIPAGALPPGGSIVITGTGIISATTLGSPMFMLMPWVTPAGGSRVDLPGFSAQPLIGVVGMTWIDMRITQTPSGLLTSGTVSYAQPNSANNYPNPINNGMAVVASDWTIARTFGVDGSWSAANAANYVTPQAVAAYLCPPGA